MEEKLKQKYNFIKQIIIMTFLGIALLSAIAVFALTDKLEWDKLFDFIEIDLIAMWGSHNIKKT